MRRNIFSILALAIIVASTLCGCNGSKSHDDSRTLVVSVEPLQQMLEDIVGDKFEVISLIPAGSNPESFEPPMSKRVALDRSKAFFSTDLLPSEQNLETSLPPHVRVCNVSANIDLLFGTHEHAHHHNAKNHHHENQDADEHTGQHTHVTDADPHVWASVKNARIILKNMANEMAKIDPQNKDYYHKRYIAADARLDSLDHAIATRLADSGASAFAVWHPSLSYFARDYGLKQIAIGQESKEMSPKQLQQIIDNAKQNKVTTFFFQKEFDSRQAIAINKSIGSRLLSINPTAYDWSGELIKVTDALAPNK